MSYSTRKLILENIERYRSRPAITYVTSIRPALNGNITGDSIEYIIRQIDKIPKTEKSIDVVIISNGGDAIAPLRIISILRERFKHISVLVPYVAYSAATILALGADEIIMHPYSNLGPVDPQLTFSGPSENGAQTQINFSSEEIRNFIDFAKNDVGITDQEHLATAFNALTQQIGVIPVGFSKRSQQLSLSASVKMLKTHMRDSNKAMEIANKLNSSYYHHGYAVGRAEARELGLKVISPKDELEGLMWSLWQDYADEMKCNSVFDISAILLNNKEVSQWFYNLPLVDFMVNLSPQVAQEATNALANQFFVTTKRPPLECKELTASIESTREAFATYMDIRITYWRDANLALSFTANRCSSGWQRYVDWSSNQ